MKLSVAIVNNHDNTKKIANSCQFVVNNFVSIRAIRGEK